MKSARAGGIPTSRIGLAAKFEHAIAQQRARSVHLFYTLEPPMMLPFKGIKGFDPARCRTGRTRLCTYQIGIEACAIPSYFFSGTGLARP